MPTIVEVGTEDRPRQQQRRKTTGRARRQSAATADNSAFATPAKSSILPPAGIRRLAGVGVEVELKEVGQSVAGLQRDVAQERCSDRLRALLNAHGVTSAVFIRASTEDDFMIFGERDACGGGYTGEFEIPRIDNSGFKTNTLPPK